MNGQRAISHTKAMPRGATASNFVHEMLLELALAYGFHHADANGRGLMALVLSGSREPSSERIYRARP